MALLPPLVQSRQLMTSRDDIDTEDRLVIDSRSTPLTPVMSDADKRSPQPYWPSGNETCSPPQPMSGSFDALLQKYAPGCAVDGAGVAPLSMGLQLLQQCVEKSLTAAQKAPSLASLGATHELRNSALAFHRPSPMPVSSSDVTSMLPTDGQKTFTCQICSNFTAANYSDLQRHVTTHLEQGEESQGSADVQMDLQETHSDDLVSASPPAPSATHSRSSSTKVFRCRQCSFVAPTKTDYWIHGRIHMRQDRMLQCPRCPFITEYKHHLEYHLRNHLGSKPFKCSTCNYACVNKSMLNSHMKSHTNVYQYRCADCSYASKYCHSLKVHLEKTSHRPASILNPDGSMPAADAVAMVTGTSDILSSQMPIRRRKNGASATPISYSNVPLAVGQPPSTFAMAGQSAVQGAWSSRQSSGDAPPPLVPISNLASSLGAPGVHGELACSYCPFTTTHYVLLQQHLAVSHLGPVAMRPFPFGVAPLQDPSAVRAYPQPHLPTGDFNRAIVTGTGSFLPEHSSSPDLSPRKRSYSFIEARSTASGQQYEPAVYGDMQGYEEDRRRSYSFAVNRPSLARPTTYSEQRWPSVHELKHSSEMAPISVLEKAGDSYSQAGSSPDSEKMCLPNHTATGELPLDLSGATTGKMSPGLAEESEEVKASKDSHLEEYMDVANSHLPPRKRCRKGKAYKLDMTSVVDDVNDLNKVSPSIVTTPPAITSGDLHLVPSSPTADDLDLRGVNEAHRTSPMSLDKKPAILTMADTYTVVERRVSFDAESVGGGSYGSVGSPSRSLPESLDGGARTVSEGRAGQGTLHECRHCDMAFGDYFMYMMHKGYHGYQDPFTCNICGERTNNKLDFFLHIARVAHA